MIAPPRYVMTTTTLERTEGLSVLNQAMAAIKEKIEEKRGVFNIQMEVSDISIKILYYPSHMLPHSRRVFSAAWWGQGQGPPLGPRCYEQLAPCTGVPQ